MRNKKTPNFNDIEKLQIEQKKLKFLLDMNIDVETKRKLQGEALKWLKWMEKHSKSMDHPYNNMFHEGSMSWIKTFFFSKTNKNSM